MPMRGAWRRRWARMTDDSQPTDLDPRKNPAVIADLRRWYYEGLLARVKGTYLETDVMSLWESDRLSNQQWKESRCYACGSPAAYMPNPFGQPGTFLNCYNPDCSVLPLIDETEVREG